MFNRLKSFISKEKDVAAERAFIVGEKIKVIEGACTGFLGTIESVDAGKKTVWALLTIADKQFSAQLKYGHVESIEDAG